MIVWGKKITFKKTGFGAVFCPFCRDIRQFKLAEMRLVSHLYFVPLGRGRLVGHQLECLECQAKWIVEDNPFELTDPNPSDSTAESIAKTNPSLPAQIAQRLEIERNLRASRLPADPEIRRSLLFEPFAVLAPTMERGVNETRIDIPSALGCLGSIVAIGLSFFVGAFLTETFWKDQPADEVIIFTMLGVGIAGSAWTLWQLHLSSRRWLEKYQVPHLVRALTPLSPTSAELTEILEAYRYQGMLFAKFLRLSAFELGETEVVMFSGSSAKPLTPR